MSEKRRNEKLVRICSPSDIVEYAMFKGALQQAGIECMNTPHYSGAYDGLFVASRGYADIYVFESDKDKADKILNELKQTKKKEE